MSTSKFNWQDGGKYSAEFLISQTYACIVSPVVSSEQTNHLVLPACFTVNVLYKLLIYLLCITARWCNCYGVGLAFERSQVRLQAVSHSQVTTLGKLFTHVCLCRQAV